MKYRIVDWTSCRGDFEVDGDEIIESSLDIYEVAKNLIKDRFQELYDYWKVSKNIDGIGREGFLEYYCEFFDAQSMIDSVWVFANGEEQSRFLIAENSKWFDYKFPDDRVFSWPDDGIFEVFQEHNWGDPEYSFESLTGVDPYKVGWDNFDCAKVLADAGIIKL